MVSLKLKTHISCVLFLSSLNPYSCELKNRNWELPLKEGHIEVDCVEKVEELDLSEKFKISFKALIIRLKLE